MKKTPLQPAYGVILELGGAMVVAEFLKLHKSTVYRWMKSEDDGGTGGLVPAEYQEILLTWGMRQGKAIKPESFFRSPKVPSRVARPQRAVA